jgi:pentatricopeptide repeat protein
VAAEIAAMAPGTLQLNIFAWNQKLTKYVEDGQLEKAMQLFQQMQGVGVSPNKFTFVQVIKACAGLGTLQDGRLVHKQLIQTGSEFDVFVGVAWWTCMQNVGIMRMLGEFSTGCHLKMWLLGPQ